MDDLRDYRFYEPDMIHPSVWPAHPDAHPDDCPLARFILLWRFCVLIATPVLGCGCATSLPRQSASGLTWLLVVAPFVLLLLSTHVQAVAVDYIWGKLKEAAFAQSCLPTFDKLEVRWWG